MPIKDSFPEVDSNYMEGKSNGWEYRLIFGGASLKHSYQMVRQFLVEEGYDDVPLPKDEKELSLFRIPTRNKQILLFEDNGYVHNPIKILFPLDRRKKTTLILCIYNTAVEDHLIRFHRIKERLQ